MFCISRTTIPFGCSTVSIRVKQTLYLTSFSMQFGVNSGVNDGKKVYSVREQVSIILSTIRSKPNLTIQHYSDNCFIDSDKQSTK